VETGQTHLAGVVGLVRGVVQLAGDEDIGAAEAKRADGLADLLLVAVHLSGVDVAVADIEGFPHRIRGVIGLDLEDSETELRDGVAVV
jgi:hypothetical protein